MLALLHEPTERIDTIRWTIVEHLAQFGLHEMWDEADQMMSDGFKAEHCAEGHCTPGRGGGAHIYLAPHCLPLSLPTTLPCLPPIAPCPLPPVPCPCPCLPLPTRAVMPSRRP